MSKASKRYHANLNRRAQRAGRRLMRTRRGRLLFKSNETVMFAELQIDFRSRRIKSFDVDQAVDFAIGQNTRRYAPSRDSAKKMCGDLDICGGTMNGVLITVSSELNMRGWSFRYDDAFIANAHVSTVRDLKTSVYGVTR